MTKDEYFKLCTALVQEQVYAWGIASSFVCLGSPPGMADAMLLKPNWSIGTYRVTVNGEGHARHCVSHPHPPPHTHTHTLTIDNARVRVDLRNYQRTLLASIQMSGLFTRHFLR